MLSGYQSIDAKMAENKNEVSSSFRTSTVQISGLNPTSALQMQAIRQGDGELAILLDTKKSERMEAAATYTQLSLQKHITLDVHHHEMKEQARLGQSKQEALPAAVPEYIAIELPKVEK